jgi:hypothetical protein
MTNPKTKQKHEYPAEFKASAIQLALTSDKPRTVIAKELSVGFNPSPNGFASTTKPKATPTGQ